MMWVKEGVGKRKDYIYDCFLDIGDCNFVYFLFGDCGNRVSNVFYFNVSRWGG